MCCVSYKHAMYVAIMTLLLYVMCFSVSHAEEWKLFYQTDDGQEYFFDKASITQPEQGVVRVWQKSMQKTSKDESVETSRLHVEFYCRSRGLKFAILEGDNTEKQKTTGSAESGATTQKSNLPSRQIIDTLRENVCP